MTGPPATGAPPGVPDIRFHLPAENLRSLVTSYYFLESTGPLADFTHPEWANIRFAIRGSWRFEDGEAKNAIEPSRAALFGPSDRARRFMTEGGLVLGVGLTPIGWLTLIGSDASDFANLIVPLDRQLGVPGPEILARLVAAEDDAARVAVLDAILGARPASQSAYRTMAMRVQEALLSGEVDQVADLAEHLGIEQRTLHRVCTSVFGFPPVRLLRRQRFLRTLGKVRDRLDQPLGQLIDSGYYDQAHFNRDFKAHMGMTPLAYFRLPREALRRAAVERHRVLGAPVQGLHVQRDQG
ncbi:MAG: helix-turn-helix domain-containing protein [Sphingomonas sp.]|uniref:helix-turn-helix domain-containing protein n=1 Tax=Sphingomonas sp. TaxID=28214 RepID=UPI003F7F0211